MRKTSKLLFLFLFFLLLLFLIFHFQTKIFNFWGEKIFLVFHQRPLAIKILKHIQENKKDYYTHYLLGRLYFVENKLEKSIRHFSKSIELAKKNGFDFKESYYGRGLAYGFSSPIFLDKAKQDFEKYIEIDKEEFQKTGQHAYGAWAGYNDLAWIYFLEGNFTEAEVISRQGLGIAPDNPWLLNMLSVALIEQSRCKEAYPLLKEALNYTEQLTPKEFGEAYSGDHKKWWPKGLEAMKLTIQDNLTLCKEFN